MWRFLSVCAVLLFSAGAANAQAFLGSGSTFCYPVLTAWAAAYEKATGVQLTYQPIGSAAGITEIRHEVVDFAISEAPLDDATLLRDGLTQFPLVLGAVVPVVNLDGIAPGRLRLTGPVLADIFLGKIRKWNDPAVVALNPGLNLPDQTIMVVHRSDGSGTTFIWSEYLSSVSNEWKIKVGNATSLSWPTGFGGKGNGGVAEKIVRLSGSIGYIDYTYAMRRHLSYAVLRNQAGNFVAPNPHSMAAATEGLDWRKNQNFNVILNNAPQSDAYPIMAISFAILRKYPHDIGRTHELLKFFSWIYENGRNTASTEQYLPLPPLLVQQIKDYWLAEKIQTGMISHVVAAAP